MQAKLTSHPTKRRGTNIVIRKLEGASSSQALKLPKTSPVQKFICGPPSPPSCTSQCQILSTSRPMIPLQTYFVLLVGGRLLRKQKRQMAVSLSLLPASKPRVNYFSFPKTSPTCDINIGLTALLVQGFTH